MLFWSWEKGKYLDAETATIVCALKISSNTNLERKRNVTVTPCGHKLPNIPHTLHGYALNQMPSRYISSGKLGPFVALQNAPSYSQ